MICIAEADSQCKRGVQKILTGCNNERNLRRGHTMENLLKELCVEKTGARCLLRSFTFEIP